MYMYIIIRIFFCKYNWPHKHNLIGCTVDINKYIIRIKILKIFSLTKKYVGKTELSCKDISVCSLSDCKNGTEYD